MDISQAMMVIEEKVLLQEQREEPEQPVAAKALPWDDYNAE